jgi:DNA gyrase subunit A
VIALIRGSRDPDIAKDGLIKQFKLSEIQAKAILEMRLQRLTGLEREKIQTEYKEVMDLISRLTEILESEEIRMNIIKDELTAVEERFGDDRRTTIEHAADDLTAEDMIPDEEMVITISHEGYIKRTALTEYRTQGRGGVGSRGATSKTDDFVEHLFTATNHNYLLIFTQMGKVFWKKVWQIPEGGKATKGRAIQNLINIESGDKVKAVINVKNLTDEDYINNNFIVMCTTNGTIKKTSLEAYSRPRTNGINAINIADGDFLLEVKLTNGDQHIIIATEEGQAVHFHESDVRAMGRTATGVRGVRLSSDKNKAIGMVCVPHEEATLLVVSEKGFGKRSAVSEYRITKRGGKGVKAMNVTEKTGKLVAIKAVVDTDDLMIINKSGITIRLEVSGLRVMGRATQGVKLIRLNEGDEISSVEKIEKMVDDDQQVENDDQNKPETEE